MADQQNQRSVAPARIFTPGFIFRLGGGFLAAFLLANRLVKWIDQEAVHFDRPRFWPISIFLPRLPNFKQALAAIAAAVGFVLVAIVLSKIRYRLSVVILAGILLIIGTNLIQGYQTGFVIPIAAGGEKGGQYYGDALKIGEADYFLSHFEEIQPRLQVHGRTHPPGAVLLFYSFQKFGISPALISIILAMVSVILSSLFLSKLFSLEFHHDELQGYLCLIFLLVPAIQIYYAASLDALIAGLLTGALYFILHPRPAIGIMGSVCFIGLASFLTFGVVFILPVMIGYELWLNKSLWRSATVLLGLGFIYLATCLISHFNYLASFLIATRLENPRGFYLFADPASYIFTRLEGVCEIVLFLGPFLGWLLVKGIGTLKQSSRNLFALAWLGALTLAVMFLAGAFHTGETARACLFIYPYLLFPVAGYFRHGRVSAPDAKILPALVFFQSLGMQIFGFYFW